MARRARAPILARPPAAAAPRVNPLSPQDERALRDGLAALGLDDGALATALGRYVALIAQWNRAYNLTAVRDPSEMVRLHLLDALSLAAPLAADRERLLARQPGRDHLRLADIGAGAGLPGIPLALALPWLEVDLVDTVGKKARFMREAVRQLGLGERVRVHHARAEAVTGLPPHDCLTARAFGTLAVILAAGGHLLGPGGRLLAMKGQHPTEEIAALPQGWALVDVSPLAVPGLAAERHLVRVAKAAATS